MKNTSRLYLEKICQDIYHLPLPSETQKAVYFEALLKDRMSECHGILGYLLDLVKTHEVLPPFPRSIKIWANVIISFCCQPHIQAFLKEKKEVTKRRKAFLIITYLYAFHFEVYHLSVLYPDFYNELFFEFCTNPYKFKSQKGEYPVLTTLKIPRDVTDAELQAGGQDSSELEDKMLMHRYPDRNFRRVLWIGKLVKETGTLTGELRRKLTMEAPFG